MDGVIYVAPTPFFSRVAIDGQFTITGAPPGQYRLKTWQRKQRYLEKDLQITINPNAEPANIEIALDKK
jgi:hypothetical protein